ncbi:MAG: tRNA-dihydrouridine synthase, partial [Oscillospiraceae bacterium]|nr:tRNA-dihydrouridine synthase [Oscillospiraceae bacterium]
MRIGNIEVDSKLYLAPMAGVTDAAFRQVCREHGAGLSCTELVSAKALCYNDEKSKKLLFLAPNERPGVVQIFGNDPEEMARAARTAIEVSGADILDINMGCPVHKVAAHGSGAALMRDIDKAAAIAAAVVDAVDVPVIAAGGIGDSRGICAAFALGAQAVQMGTRFVMSEECIAHPNYKNLVLKARDRSTVITGRTTGHPAR